MRTSKLEGDAANLDGRTSTVEAQVLDLQRVFSTNQLWLTNLLATWRDSGERGTLNDHKTINPAPKMGSYINPSVPSKGEDSDMNQLKPFSSCSLIPRCQCNGLRIFSQCSICGKLKPFPPLDSARRERQLWRSHLLNWNRRQSVKRLIGFLSEGTGYQERQARKCAKAGHGSHGANFHGCT